MFYSIIGREDGEFDICDVCNQEADKLMFRHPFINWKEEGEWTVANPDMYINDAGQVVYKESEKAETGKAESATGKAEAGSSEETLALGACKPKNAASVEKTWEQIKQQESDCLDTWFSSWLWPISLFDGIEHPDNEEINFNSDIPF